MRDNMIKLISSGISEKYKEKVMRSLRRQGYKNLSSIPYVKEDGGTYYHIYYGKFEKPKKAIYIDGLGDVIIAPSGKYKAYKIKEFDGTISYTIMPDESRGDKILKVIKVNLI